MENRYMKVRAELKAFPRRWLVTGAAGFHREPPGGDAAGTGAGCHGARQPLHRKPRNLAAVLEAALPDAERRFTLVEGDIRDPPCAERPATGRSSCSTRRPWGSVPRSIADPAGTSCLERGRLSEHDVLASRDAQVKLVRLRLVELRLRGRGGPCPRWRSASAGPFPLRPVEIRGRTAG